MFPNGTNVKGVHKQKSTRNTEKQSVISSNVLPLYFENISSRFFKSMCCRCSSLCLILSLVGLLFFGVGIAALLVAFIVTSTTTMTTTIPTTPTTTATQTTTTPCTYSLYSRRNRCNRIFLELTSTRNIF